MSRLRACIGLCWLGAACSGGEPAPASQPSAAELAAPPVGLAAYRALPQLYRVRIGARTYMRSTYDRAGGNEAADASHFLRQDAPDFHVTLDVAGPGVLYFVRTNRWHGSPWHYVVDGVDHVVSESSTADPLEPRVDSVFMPEAAFPSPLTYTWATTRGADLNWVPIAFAHSFTLAYERTHYGTGYYIYQQLSRPVAAFDAAPPDADVLQLLGRAGEDIGSHGRDTETIAREFDLPAGARVQLASLRGPRTLVALKLRLPRAQAEALAEARLVVHWDDLPEASIDAPLALFFGSPTLYNRDDRPWLVRGLLTNIRFAADSVELASYFPMPFASHARIELAGAAEPARGLSFELRTEPLEDPPGSWAHFHATYRDHGTPQPGRDLVFLDTAQTEGGGDYCGSFHGMSFSFSDRAELTTLEGDPRFFFDDSESPQAYGAGTEDWAGGGDYWGGETMTLPLAGHPVGAPDPASAHNTQDLVQGAYRVLLADAMPFGKNARIQFEHGGLNDSMEHYRTVSYWYGRRGACLVETDSLDVGEPPDERTHHYDSDASAITSVTSRYELGVDHVGDEEIIAETTDRGRAVTVASEFDVALRADNLGVLLRRKLDYAYPDQRADVFVSAADGGWRAAGTWYLAGSNRDVFSFPPGELDPPTPILQTSPRRFREDEFLIARELTAGRSQIRLRIVFRPLAQPLVPGEPVPALAWSELRYRVYSWVLSP
jgi:hypothetical protein